MMIVFTLLITTLHQLSQLSPGRVGLDQRNPAILGARALSGCHSAFNWIRVVSTMAVKRERTLGRTWDSWTLGQDRTIQSYFQKDKYYFYKMVMRTHSEVFFSQLRKCFPNCKTPALKEFRNLKGSLFKNIKLMSFLTLLVIDFENMRAWITRMGNK